MEAVNQPPDPGGYQEPCYGDERDRNSDLCAQWTAANGARNAAYYARLQLWAAAAGMFGLVITIILTLKAVKAAQKSVEVAQDTARRQLRAYLTIEHVDFSGVAAGEKTRCRVCLKNTGQTPAEVIAWDNRMRFADRDDDEANLVPSVELQSTIGHVGSQGWAYGERVTHPLPPEIVDAVMKGQYHLYILGTVHYRDVFGTERFTKYRLRYIPEALSFGHTAKGNEYS